MKIRPYEKSDARALTNLIRALAEYEHLAAPPASAARRLIREIGRRRIHVLMAEVDGEAVGYAIYYFTYSSFRARPTLWLEDLFVRPEQRRGGIGRRFFASLRAVARRERCARIEWVVLDWNEPAQRFYRELGARPLEDWIVYRLELERSPTPGNRGARGSRARPIPRG